MNGQITPNNKLISKAYSMGKFTIVIWGEDFDVEYFMDNLTKMPFGKVIHDIYKLNLEAQQVVQHVMRTLGTSIQLDST
jgi:hypothetical protein